MNKEKNMDKEKDKEKKLLLLIVILSLLVRIGYIFLFTTPQNYINSDMSFYDQYADALVNGKQMPMWPAWAPFFYIYLAGWYWIFKLLGIYPLKYYLLPIIHSLIFALCTYLIFETTKKLSNARAALIASMIYAFYYPYIYLNIFVMSENLFFPLIIISLYLITCKLEKRRTYYLLGFLIALASLARPVLLLFIPAFMLWTLLYQEKPTFKIFLFLVPILLLFCAQAAFNYSMTEGKVKGPFSNGALNMAFAWCDLRGIIYNGDYHWEFGPPAAIYYPESKIINTTVEFTNQPYYYSMAFECLKKDPKQLLYRFKGITRLFQSQLFPWYQNIAGWRVLILIFKIITAVLLIPFSFYSISKIKRKDILILFGLLLLSVFAIEYLANAGEERHFIPFTIVFIILGSIGMESFLHNHFIEERKKKDNAHPR